MNREVNEVCSYLRSKSIHIPADNDWLSSCVECFIEQGNRNITELRELVYQQWLLADLADIGVQAIPKQCLTNEKCILESRYAVQLNYFVNVALSFHKQMQKVRCPDSLKNLEVDSEVTTSFATKGETGIRMLKMEITDGVVTVSGFEDHYISSLKEPFVPGMKAILVGPIECRKGVLFLKSNNINLLGGEVDALHILNATENVLARALGLPENPDPYSQLVCASTGGGDSTNNDNVCLDDEDEAMMMLADVIEKRAPDRNLNEAITGSATTTRNVLNRQTEVSVVPQHTEMPNSRVSHTEHGITLSSEGISSRKTISKPVPNNVFNIPEYVDLDFDDDFELLAAQSATSAELSSAGSATRNMDNDSTELRTYEMFDSAPAKKDLEEITNLRRRLNESYSVSTLKQNTSNQILSEPLNIREDGKIIVDYLSDKVSPLTKLPFEPDLCDTLPSTSQASVDDLFSIDPFPPRKRPATVTTFSRVIRVLKKPKLKGDKWLVSALVEAKSIQIEVSFHSDVIDQIFSVTAAEITSRREEFANDPIKKQIMNELLKQSQLRFSKLACNMTFSFKDAISEPVIIDVAFDR